MNSWGRSECILITAKVNLQGIIWGRVGKRQGWKKPETISGMIYHFERDECPCCGLN